MAGKNRPPAMNLNTAMKKFEVSTSKNGTPFLRFKGRVVKGGENARRRKTTAPGKTKTGQATSWKRLAEKANRLGVNVVTKKLPVTSIPRSYRKSRTQLITGILNKKNALPVWKPGKSGRPKMTNEERAASRAFSRRKQKGKRKLQKLGKNLAARKIQRAYRAKKAKKQTPNFVNSFIVNARANEAVAVANERLNEATKKRKAAQAELGNARVVEKNAIRNAKRAKANARNAPPPNAPPTVRRSKRLRGRK